MCFFVWFLCWRDVLGVYVLAGQLVGGMFGLCVGWSVGWRDVWFVCWLVSWLEGCLVSVLACQLVGGMFGLCVGWSVGWRDVCLCVGWSVGWRAVWFVFTGQLIGGTFLCSLVRLIGDMFALCWLVSWLEGCLSLLYYPTFVSAYFYTKL